MGLSSRKNDFFSGFIPRKTQTSTETPRILQTTGKQVEKYLYFI